jgi:hypothetical protein
VSEFLAQKETFSNKSEYFDAILANTPRAKPVVHYHTMPDGSSFAKVDEVAFVIPVDHPAQYLNGDVVRTSYIVEVFEDGFETRNTRYVLAK